MDVVTFETAVKLKEAGFPQPLPDVGQVWYNDLYPLVIIEGFDCSFRLEAFEHGPEYSHEILDWFADDPKNTNPNFSGEVSVFSPIYAPTATDILRELPGCKMFYSATSDTWICQHTVSGKFHGNKNPAEAAAKWLELRAQ